MTQSSNRHWSLFLGIWSLAALAPIALFLPIFTRTLFTDVSHRTRPEYYVDLLEADLMKLAIGAVLLVAVIQTALPAVNRAARVLLPHLTVWAVLGLSLLVVSILQPLPPPLRTTLGDVAVSVPRSFAPEARSRYVQIQERLYPKLRFHVCKGTALPPYGAGCESMPIEIETDTGIGTAFPTRIPATAYADYLEANALETWDGTGEVLEATELFTLIVLPETSASDRVWVTKSYVTLDAAGRPVRFAGCREGQCFVTAETKYGFVTYQMPPEASQALADRMAFENALILLIDGWAD